MKVLSESSFTIKLNVYGIRSPCFLDQIWTIEEEERDRIMIIVNYRIFNTYVLHHNISKHIWGFVQWIESIVVERKAWETIGKWSLRQDWKANSMLILNLQKQWFKMNIQTVKINLFEPFSQHILEYVFIIVLRCISKLAHACFITILGQYHFDSCYKWNYSWRNY